MLRPYSALTALLVLLGAASADASDLIALRADVPFSFQVGEATLPPGAYTFRFDTMELAGVLRVRSQNGRGGALILARNAEIPQGSGDQPKLIFEKDGDQYVLSQVLDPDRYGIQVLNPRSEGERPRIAVLAN